MADRILFPHSQTGLPRESTDSTIIRVGQLELASLDPLVLEFGSNMVPNLDSERLGGLDKAELKTETLTDKKVVEERGTTANVFIGNTEVIVTSMFLSGHTEFAYTLRTTPTVEGVVLYNVAGYYECTVVDENSDFIPDPDNNRVFGVVRRLTNSLDSSGVTVTWTNSSTTVDWSGSFVNSPSDYVNEYLQSPDGTLYKVQSFTDSGGTGTFTLYDLYQDTAGSNGLIAITWKIAFYSVDVGPSHVYTFIADAALSIYYPYRTNLGEMNERMGATGNADFISPSSVTQADLDELRHTPILLDSSAGTVAGFDSYIDVFNLTSSFVLKGAGVGITLGGPLDIVNMNTVIAQSLNAISFSINGVAITATAAELNQLAGIGTSVSASNLNLLTGGYDKFTDLHQHTIRLVISSGNIGDVVYVNASSQTVVAIGDPGVDTNGYKVIGIIADIDSMTGDALVITEGLSPIYAGHGYADGVTLYLSTNSAGKMTSTISSTSGYHIVKIGQVVNGWLIIDVRHLWQN